MKYGGVVFEIDVAKPVKCNVWVRAWWKAPAATASS